MPDQKPTTEPKNYLLRRHFAGPDNTSSSGPPRLASDAAKELTRQHRLSAAKPQEILLTHQCANHAQVLNIAAYLHVQHFSVRVHHLAASGGDVLLTPAAPLPDDGFLMVLLDSLPLPADHDAAGYVEAAVQEYRRRHGSQRIGVFPLLDASGALPPPMHPFIEDLPLICPNELPAFVRGWRRGKTKSET